MGSVLTSVSASTPDSSHPSWKQNPLSDPVFDHKKPLPSEDPIDGIIPELSAVDCVVDSRLATIFRDLQYLGVPQHRGRPQEDHRREAIPMKSYIPSNVVSCACKARYPTFWASKPPAGHASLPGDAVSSSTDPAATPTSRPGSGRPANPSRRRRIGGTCCYGF